MKIYQANDVFTPSMPAQYNFVERPPVLIKSVVNALTTPGKQIIIYGDAGVGKTSLIINKVKQHYSRYITTSCSDFNDFNSVLYDAFDKLGKFYNFSDDVTNKVKVSGQLKALFAEIKSVFVEEHVSHKRRIIPIQLTPSRLADFLGEIKACWILEDFHKVEKSERVKFAQSMKIFMDKSVDYKFVKMIIIGAVNTPRKMIEADYELGFQRLTEVKVNEMTNSELLKIIHGGSNLLNIHFTNEVISNIIEVAQGSASMVHQLCLNMCSENDIYSTCSEEHTFTVKDFSSAMDTYFLNNRDNLIARIEKGVGKIVKGKVSHSGIILETLSSNLRTSYSPGEIISLIVDNNRKYKNKNISRNLKALTKNKRGALLLYNDASGKYILDSEIFTALKYYFSGNKSNHYKEDYFHDLNRIDITEKQNIPAFYKKRK